VESTDTETRVVFCATEAGDINKIGACIYEMSGWRFVPTGVTPKDTGKRLWPTYQLCIPQWFRNKTYKVLTLSDYNFVYQPNIPTPCGETEMTASNNEFTLEDFLGEYGLKDKILETPAKKPVAVAERSPRNDFVAAVNRELVKARAAADTNIISEKTVAGAVVLEMANGEALAPPTRGKSANWFVWKNNQLVVSSYASNAAVFPPVAFKSWSDAIGYLEKLVEAANAGKLDSNFAAIKTKRLAKKAAKAAKDAEMAATE